MTKSGFVAIVGPANVGKSTFLNRCLGIKLSAVSRRAQTTAQNILGILSTSVGQLVFTDTPGLVERKGAVYSFMRGQIETALRDADIVLLIVEAGYRPDAEMERFISSVKKYLVLAINKVDLVKDKNALLPLIEQYQKIGISDIHPISALTGDGISGLIGNLFELCPEGEPYYPDEQPTTFPMRFFAAEAIRESVFEHYGEEIPYSVFVEIEEYREQNEGKDFVRAILYVERESQKPIIVGRRGEAIKRLGRKARKKIEFLSGRSIYLELHVKVAKNWRKDETFLRRAMKPPDRYLPSE